MTHPACHHGASLNTAPAEFGRIVGLHIATLSLVWQVITIIVFKRVPALPV
jgi:hypothetical protein